MNWGDVALRVVVRRRDRETISGDLLEQYREEIQPTRSALAARVWYARQVLSFIHPVAWGLLIGIAAGVLQLLNTARYPLADDTAPIMLAILGTMMLLWMCVSIAVSQRRQRFSDAVVSGVFVGLATMAMVHVSSVIRVNVFLDTIRGRDDWVNLISRFYASDFHSLRAYANYEYLRSLPILLALGAVVGGICGLMGGVISRFVRTALETSKIP
jgi:hypothetical protein